MSKKRKQNTIYSSDKPVYECKDKGCLHIDGNKCEIFYIPSWEWNCRKCRCC